MADVDPETLLEWLQMGQGEERDMQLIALEQLCMLLLMSDNVDRCFESCPPRTFLPALCKIFLDEHAPDNVLEVTARAITYYLDVSAECTRRIVAVDGAVKALCNRLVVVELSSRTSKDLAEQCIKVLENMCTRESGAIFEAGGLHCVLTFIRDNGSMVHKDTLHSAMAVVSRLCGKMEPSDPSLETCVESLSTLLKHEDPHVADGALRCFASLADRFTRRGVDPAPLAKHGLTAELLERLANCGMPAAALASGAKTSVAASAGTTPDSKGNPNISTVISLLSTLCRGSPSVTHDLLRSQLPEAIEQALRGDERCVLDTMRLVDLLLVLLFEGRKALPKTNIGATTRAMAGLRRLDSAGERSHRHLIDCIRSKDTDALIDAIDTGAVEVNYMDDVGQTLLNWASAFGTQEMVEFLCERGADVNRGQRSSSLHYAACFGRPQVAKTLLRHGANPDLRDEDGKSPLDKARERNDEGHREVMQILQSPGEWMVPVTPTTEAPVSPEETKPEPEDTEAKGDPEMAPIYLRKLLPIFAQVYNNTMMPSIRKASLALIRKMIHYTSPTLLSDVCTAETTGFTQVLVEVLAAVLDHEDDDDGHLTALQILQDLVRKGEHLFLDHFARLGVFSKVSSLAGPVEEIEEEGAVARERRPGDSDDTDMEDAKEVVSGKPYHWKDWCLARGRDCLYVWSDAAALELSNGSNGWFRFILDGKLATMYSSGSPEGGSDSSESRGEFLEKLHRARSQVRPGATSQPILSCVGPTKLVIGNWALQCKKEGEIVIHNSDGQQQQATILREDLAGFVFESNRGTKHSFTAETSLGPEFSTGWTGKRGKRLRSKVEQVKQKVKILARELYDSNFRVAESHPRDVVAKLHSIVQKIELACELHSDASKVSDSEEGWMGELKTALESLTILLQDESSISAYELHSSGLVQALLYCLNDGYDHVALHDRHLRERISLFKAIFKEDLNENDRNLLPAVMLIRKLVSVLESIERLPMFLYDSPGSSYGLQVLTKRLRFRLERAPGETSLIDRSGRTLKMEPLTTVASLERYLLKMVAKQWYDYERSSFTFVRRLKEGPAITFRHTHDFDENGIIYWIGTNGRSAYEWVNPAQYGLVVVNCSEGRTLPYGRLEDILSRDASALNCHTNDDRKAWFTLDLGAHVIPTAYTLRHARGYGRSALRNWLFQVSKDGNSWTTLFTHSDDCSLNEPGSTATWPLEAPKEEQGWRHIRLQQTGKNASGQTHYLSLSGFEIYGTVTGVIEEALATSKPQKEPLDPTLRKQQRRLMRSQVLRQMVVGGGRGIGRGIEWNWRELEAGQSVDSALVAEHREAVAAAAAAAAAAAGKPITPMEVTKPSSSIVGAVGTPIASTDKPEVTMATVAGTGTTTTSGYTTPTGSTTTFGTSRKSSSTPSLSATTAGETKTTTVRDKDHASTSDLTATTLATAASMVDSALSVASGLSSMLSMEDPRDVPHVLASVGFPTHHERAEAAPILEASCEDIPGKDVTPSTVTSTNNQNSMSVSVPNLSSTREVVAGLMESFPNLMRRSGSSGNGSTTLSGRGSSTFTSSFVRFPLSSGLSSSNFLSSAQSAPNLPSATTTVANANTTNVAGTHTVASTLSSVLATSLTSTSSESDNEFLESCRASSLLAELEDDEFCPQPEELDDENEDDSEGDDYDECTEEEDYDPRGHRRRTWDDEHVLKRQFSALVPAFDPRPGRTNVQQTTDLEIPPPGSPDVSFQDEAETVAVPHLSLFIRGPGLPGIPETEVYCDDPQSTIFKYVQLLYQNTPSGTKQERLRRIWEPTYTVVYREARPDDGSLSATENTEGRWSVDFVERHVGSDQLPKSELIAYLQRNADVHFLRRWKLTGASKSIRKTKNCSQLVASYKEFVQLGLAKLTMQRSRHSSGGRVLSPVDCGMPVSSRHEPAACTVDDVLQLLRILYALASDISSAISRDAPDYLHFNVPLEEFSSKKITNKLMQQVQDPLVLASLSLPIWCEKLTNKCPMLFPFETRHLFFSCTAFGVSRAIAWLQDKRDASVERVRTPSTRRDDQHEFRVGRLKHERVKVPRGEQLLEWAVNVMRLHSHRKSILEVEFLSEEGTGLGPTLEFYALVSAEVQRKRLGMWLCDDDFPDDMSREVDIGEGIKPPGFYIQRATGLFPAPLVQDSEDVNRVIELFRFLGTFLAKCLQDTRLVDIPLSRPFLKLMCMGDAGSSIHPSFSPESSLRDSDVFLNETPSEASLDDLHELISDMSMDESESKAELILGDPPKPRTPAWFAGLLTWDDFEQEDPHRAQFLRQLRVLVDRKRQIQRDKSKTEEERNNEIQNLALENPAGCGPPVKLEDIGLTFQFNPSSKVYGYTSFDLKASGEEETVTLDNAEEYIELVTDFCLHTGIRRQMEAFRDGFNEVFPLEKLHSFTPAELQTMMCGDQAPQWSREDVLNYTEPKLGYTRESPGFQRFVNVMVSMNSDERKSFLQFTTGCSSLPPGGLANLHPRLTIVRKVDANDNTYPSVNTCVHYLKLPEYTSEEIMRERLLSATTEKGFHLN